MRSGMGRVPSNWRMRSPEGYRVAAGIFAEVLPIERIQSASGGIGTNVRGRPLVQARSRGVGAEIGRRKLVDSRTRGVLGNVGLGLGGRKNSGKDESQKHKKNQEFFHCGQAYCEIAASHTGNVGGFHQGRELVIAMTALCPPIAPLILRRVRPATGSGVSGRENSRHFPVRSGRLGGS